MLGFPHLIHRKRTRNEYAPAAAQTDKKKTPESQNGLTEPPLSDILYKSAPFPPFNNTMKPRTLRVLLLLAALQHSAQADQSFLAEGVNRGDITASERFYDNGKGYYWQGYNLNTAANELYNSTGRSWDFLGELAERVPAGADPNDSSSQAHFYDKLTDDANTCWYNVSANVLQYWLNDYGVFYRGSGDDGQGGHELPYGYTYSKEYLSQLGGTQSLRVDMYFYDNWENVGGNTTMSMPWFLGGYNEDPDKSGSAQGGFFQEYFSSTDATYRCVASQGGFSLSAILSNLVEGMGLTQNSDGSYSCSTPGQIIDFGISATDENGQRSGHALTCYGFNTNDNGELTSILITNSDDQFYGLVELYLKTDDSNGKVYLYSDAECTQRWDYADLNDWCVDQLGWIDTPEVLKDMYRQYNDADTPLVWNGNGSEWNAADAGEASYDELPTAATGWDVYVSQGEFSDHYHSWYKEGRPIEFNDHGSADSSVRIVGNVGTPKLILSNSSAVTYRFTGDGSNSITANAIEASGGGRSEFYSIGVQADSVSIRALSTLSLGEGSSLSAQSVRVGSSGVLELAGGTLAAEQVTIGANSAFAVTGKGGSFTGSTLTLEGGSTLSFDFSSADSSSPLLSMSGNMTLNGTVTLKLTGSLVDGATYNLISFASGATLSSNWSSLFTGYDGTLSFSDNVLSIVYSMPAQLTWNSGSGTWSSGTWNNGSADSSKASVTFAATGTPATITVNGTVTPGAIAITGGQYSFTPGAEGGTIGGNRDLSISGGAAVSTELNFADRRISLSEGASLTYNLSGENAIRSLNLAEGTSVTFAQDGSYRLQDSTSLNGSIKVTDSANLSLELADDAVVADLSTDAGSTVSFRNSSTDKDINYTLGSSPEKLKGAVRIGDAADAHVTNLNIAAESSTAFSIADGSKLTLNGTGSFQGTTDGSGSVEVAQGADVSFAPDSSSRKLKLGSENELIIKGQATAGARAAEGGSGTDGTPVCGSDAAITVAKDGSLTAYVSKYRGSSFSRLTLDGGSATFDANGLDSPSSSSSPLARVEQLHVTSQGGSLNLIQQDVGYGGANVVAVGQLSGEGGALNFSVNKAWLNPHLLRIESTAEGYMGDLNVSVSQDAFANDYSCTAGAELQSGSLGRVTLSAAGVLDHARASFGVAGEVTIGGINGDETGYLYSGSMATTNGMLIANTDEGVRSSIKASSHTLTIDTESSNTFAGDVFKGKAAGSSGGILSIVKRGSGSQSFTGSILEGLQGGSFSVEGGTLSISAELTATDVAIATGSLLDLNGSRLTVTGNLSVGSPSGLAPASAVSSAPAALNSAGSASPSLNAKLDLTQASSLSFSSALDLNGNDLVLSDPQTQSMLLTLAADMTLGAPGMQDLTLFTNVGSLLIGNGSYESAIDADLYLQNELLSEKSMLVFADGNLMLTNVYTTPEPTTATLSLLGLAGLLLRRRRRV